MKIRNLTLIMLWYTVIDGRRYRKRKLSFDSFSVHHLYWNSSNPIFDVFSNSIRSEYNYGDEAPVMKVKLLDLLVIHCPQYITEQFEDLAEQSLIYMVSKYGFERCLLDHTARLVAQCNHMPASKGVVRRVFRRKGGAFGKLAPGNEYYLISTSSGTPDGLHRSQGGLCAEKNLRIKIQIEKESFEKASPVKIEPIYFTENDNINRKANELNANNELFMTEEFNELTWKKKIIDPRVPESERKFGGKIISSLPLDAVHREHLKFAKTRQVDRPLPIEQYGDQLLPMTHTTGSDWESIAPSLSPSSESQRLKRRHRVLLESRTNSAADKFGGKSWRTLSDDDDGDDMEKSREKLEFTQTEEFTHGLHSVGTVELVRLDDDSSYDHNNPYDDRERFTLMFYDRPSESVQPYPPSLASTRSSALLMLWILIILHSFIIIL